MSEEEKGTEEQAGDAAQQVENVTTEVVVDKEKEGMTKAYQAEKEKRQALEAEKESLQQQLMSAATAPSQPQAPSSNFEQAVIELGLKDIPYLTQEQTMAIEARKEQLDQVKSNQRMAQMTGKQFVDSHDDFSEAVGTWHPITGNFIPSPELSEILKKEPHLTAAIHSGPSAAYKIVMKHRTATKKEKEYEALKEHQDRLKLDDNLTPMSPSSAGGGGGALASKLKNATYDDIVELERRVEAGEFEK